MSDQDRSADVVPNSGNTTILAAGETDKGLDPYLTAKPLNLSLEGEFTVDELLDMQFDDHPLPFLGRNDVIFSGNSVLLAAREKVGKSSLVRHLCQGWAADGHSVLYISEEWRRVWNRQLGHLGFERNAGHFHVVEGMDKNWFQLLTRARRGPEEIVVVDTVTWLLGLNLNNRDEVVKTLKDWTAMCHDGKTLILIAHLNKRGEVAGSHAFGAGVDTVITYRDVDGWKDLRMVELRSRMLPENPEPFAIRKTGAVFTIEEVPNELRLTEPQGEIRAVLQTDPEDAMTWEQIAAHTGFKEGKVRTILRHLIELGLARDTPGNLGTGGRGNAARYVGDVQEDAE
jgi:hypothetical protein